MNIFLLGISQKIQDIFETRFNVNCFAIERFFYILTIAFSVLFLVLTYNIPETSWYLNFCAIVLVLASFIFYFYFFRNENLIKQSLDRIGRKYVELKGYRIGMLFIFFLMGVLLIIGIYRGVIGLNNILFLVMNIFLTLATYFDSSTPLQHEAQ